MKLYSASGSCSLGTNIALEWIGQPYDVQKVGIHPKSPELLEVNAAGAVPVLEVDGWALTQNVAIYNYLLDSFPEAGLAGDDSAKARAEINRWLGFVNSELHPAFKPFFGAADYLGEEAANKAKENAKEVVRRKLEVVNKQLEEKEWLVGDRTVADAYLYVTLRWAKMMAIDYRDLTNLTGLVQRMEDDKAVQDVLCRQGQEPVGNSK